VTREQRMSLLKARVAAVQPRLRAKPKRTPRGPRERKPRASKPRTAEERASNTKRMAVSARARRAAGLCAKCGAPSPDTWACVDCRAKHSKAKRERRARRIVAGVCPMCGKPAAPGGTLCEPHRTVMRERARVERGYQRPYGPRRPKGETP